MYELSPGFSQRFATFRQGLIIHTNGAFSAPMVYPPVANAPGGVGVVVDNGLAAIGNGNTVIGGDSTVATSTTVPTPFAIDEGGGNQGGDSATKRKEGGVCESDSATKKSKITGSTHCSSPTNGYHTPYRHTPPLIDSPYQSANRNILTTHPHNTTSQHILTTHHIHPPTNTRSDSPQQTTVLAAS